MKDDKFRCGFLHEGKPTNLKRGDKAVWEKGQPLKFFRGRKILYVNTPRGQVCDFFETLSGDSINMMNTLLDLLIAADARKLHYAFRIATSKLTAVFF